MARTTAAAVQEILGDDYDGSRNLRPFIDTANVMTTRVNTCASDKGITLTTTELELIERWLAAHAYSISDQPYSENYTGKARGVYQGRTGMYLESSKYGQMAVNVDYSGCLAGLASEEGSNRVRAVWLGKPPSEQIDYEDRD